MVMCMLSKINKWLITMQRACARVGYYF